jgi:hypothetical protein
MMKASAATSVIVIRQHPTANPAFSSFSPKYSTFFESQLAGQTLNTPIFFRAHLNSIIRSTGYGKTPPLASREFFLYSSMSCRIRAAETPGPAFAGDLFSYTPAVL